MADIATLPKLYSERETAAYLGIELDTLQRTRRRGEISYTVVGKGGIKYRGADILDYLDRRTQPCRSTTTGPDDADPTGSPGAPTPPTGAAPGTTDEPSRPDVSALALKTFQPPTSRSSNGCSNATGRETPPPPTRS